MKFAGFALALLGSAAAPALAATGRLPGDVVPVSYDIEVVPNATTLRFTGRERVVVEVKAPTRAIVLNAVDLVIGGATLDGRAVKVATDAKAQTLTLMLPAAVMPGRHEIAITWAGSIGRSAAGLFAIDYTNTDGSSARMLATQFEAPDARRFAPMWDEPAFKAVFRLSAAVPRGQQGYSNMPAAAITDRADGSRLYRFGETPVMSSYLLFLGIGDLERRPVKAGATEIGVVTRKGVAAQGDYALGAATRLLAYYNDYFAQPYPLPKMDMLAGPGSSQFFGAMENWGAIFYFEKELLFDPMRTTESGRQRIHVVVAHEMAHQWFGDLVTMRWWDDLWLNEGFASWMESKAGADLNPDWHVREAGIIADRETAMALDATAATHPVIRRVRTVDEISAGFDAITYQKGQGGDRDARIDVGRRHVPPRHPQLHGEVSLHQHRYRTALGRACRRLGPARREHRARLHVAGGRAAGDADRRDLPRRHDAGDADAGPVRARRRVEVDAALAGSARRRDAGRRRDAHDRGGCAGNAGQREGLWSAGAQPGQGQLCPRPVRCGRARCDRARVCADDAGRSAGHAGGRFRAGSRRLSGSRAVDRGAGQGGCRGRSARMVRGGGRTGDARRLLCGDGAVRPPACADDRAAVAGAGADRRDCARG